MSLKLVRYPKRSKNWRIRGTVRGVAIDESTGTDSKTLAEAYRSKREAEIWERRVFGEQATVTFLEAAVSYMESIESLPQRQYVDRLRKHFKTKPLHEIGQPEAEEVVKKLFKGRSNDTIRRNCLGPLQAVLNHAGRVYKGYTPPRIDKRKWKADPGRKVWVSPEDMETLLEKLPEELRAMTLLRLYTGARMGEAIKLTWRDLDLKRARVLFRKTKTGDDRESHIPERVVVALANLPGERSGPVFPSYWSRWQVYDDWKPACEAADLIDFRPHDVCHVFGGWMHEYGGADAKRLLETGRWKDPKSVFRYVNSPSDTTKSTVGKMPGIVQKSCSKKKKGV